MRNNLRLCTIALVSTAMMLMLVSSAGAASFAYITNSQSNNVSVIDTATNSVVVSVNVGTNPEGVAVSPDGTKVYVANHGSDNISVIDTATNTVTATVDVGDYPYGVAVTPDGTKVYVTNENDANVSIIDTATNTVTSTVNVGDSPQGVAVIPNGTKVYVANHGSENVSVIDTATNTVTATVSIGFDPVAVAVNPTGTKVYVTEDHDGLCKVFTIDIATNTVIASIPVEYSPCGVAVSPDGTKVYVTNVLSDSVSIIDAVNNTFKSRVQVGFNPIGVAVTPDGKEVYVANWGDDSISIIDTATNTVKATVPVGSNPIAFGQFIGPVTVPVQTLPKANFITNVTSGYVTLSVQFTDLSTNVTEHFWDFGDGNNSNEQNPLHTYSAAGKYIVNLTAINKNGTNVTSATIVVSAKQTESYKFIKQWGSCGNGDGEFYFLNRIAVDSSGNVYADDAILGRMQKFDSNGTFLKKWGSWGSDDGHFDNPIGIAVDSSCNVYVVNNWGENCIQKFDSNGTFLKKWGSELGVFDSPCDIAVDSSGNIYVTNAAPYDHNVSVVKFDSNGTYLTQWGSYGTGNGQFNSPESIAVDSSGNVYVADYDNSRIQKFTSDGTFITKWGSYGTGNGQFNLPGGIAVDSSGNVYVADSNNNRIQKFDSNGTYVTQWGSYGTGSGQFSCPESIAVDPWGYVYVSDGVDEYGVSYRIQKFANESRSNIVTEESSQASVSSGILTSFNFSNNSTPILSLGFSTDQTLGDTLVKIELLNGRSNLTFGSPSGNVCDYLNIWINNATSVTPENFSNATISFKVSKTWVQNNKINISSIVLNRYNNGVWTKLPTTLINQDTDHLYFTASTPGFSPFAITGDVDVPSKLPEANFSCNVTKGYVPLSVQFLDSSLNSTGWNWDFGDGDSSIEQNPLHTYSTTGNYTVNLTVSNDNGTDSKLATITVLSKSIVPVFPGYTNPSTDPDNDGLYEDINGNGIQDFDDVVAYYDNMDWLEYNAQKALFDYNKNGLIDFDDVVKLYDKL